MGGFSLIPDRNNIEESIALAEEYGMDFEYNDFYIPAVLEDKEMQREIINRYKSYKADFSKDTIHGAFLDVILHSDDPQIRLVSQKRVEQSMDIGQQLGVKAVVFHSGLIGRFHETNYMKNWCDWNEDFYRKMLEKYPDLNIYVENMFDDKPDGLKSLAQRMQDCKRFGICLDHAHELLFGNHDEPWMKQLAPYIRHIHMNDNFLTDDDHLPIGQGSIAWDRFFEDKNNHKIEASMLIEVTGIKGQKQSIRYLEEKKFLNK